MHLWYTMSRIYQLVGMRHTIGNMLGSHCLHFFVTYLQIQLIQSCVMVIQNSTQRVGLCGIVHIQGVHKV